MKLENLDIHLSFLGELSEALDEAMDRYQGADESDLEELRHVRREVELALKSVQQISDETVANEATLPGRTLPRAVPRPTPVGTKAVATL